MTVALGVEVVHDREYKRGDSDEDWPESDEEVCQGGIDNRRVAPYVFEYVEPMTLNDDSCKKCAYCGVRTTREADRGTRGRLTHKESCSRRGDRVQ